MPHIHGWFFELCHCTFARTGRLRTDHRWPKMPFCFPHENCKTSVGWVAVATAPLSLHHHLLQQRCPSCTVCAITSICSANFVVNWWMGQCRIEHQQHQTTKLLHGGSHQCEWEMPSQVLSLTTSTSSGKCLQKCVFVGACGSSMPLMHSLPIGWFLPLPLLVGSVMVESEPKSRPPLGLTQGMPAQAIALLLQLSCVAWPVPLCLLCANSSSKCSNNSKK